MSNLSNEQVEVEVMDNLRSNPTFGDISKLLVRVEKGGSLFRRKPRVVLEGSVPKDMFKTKIVNSITEKYADAVEVVDELSVNGN